VLLYEPAGILQQPHRLKQLELQLLLQRLQDSVALQSGWQPGGKAGQQQQQQWAAEAGLTVVLLSAADGQWPLLAAATASGKAAGRTDQQAQQQHQEGSADVDECSAAAARDAAFAAPARLRARLQAAGGPLVGAEPDFVVVGAASNVPADPSFWHMCSHTPFQHPSLCGCPDGYLLLVCMLITRLCPPCVVLAGPTQPNQCFAPPLLQVTGPTLTLAGFPSWLVRSSEIYGVGPLAQLAAEPLDAAMQRYCRTKQRFGK